MITEDYVSFEVAKLLKEKGFDEPLYSYYKDGIFTITDLLCKYEFDVDLCRWRYNEYAAPTLQMAMKWLRISCAIEISVACFALKNYKYSVYVINSSDFNRANIVFNDNSYKTYEEACETAIKYCLENLI